VVSPDGEVPPMRLFAGLGCAQRWRYAMGASSKAMCIVKCGKSNHDALRLMHGTI